MVLEGTAGIAGGSEFRSLTAEQQRARFEELWNIGGAGYLGALADLLTNPVANEAAAFNEQARREATKFAGWTAGVQAAAAASGIRQDSKGLTSYLDTITAEHKRVQQWNAEDFAAAQSDKTSMLMLNTVLDLGKSATQAFGAQAKTDQGNALAKLRGEPQMGSFGTAFFAQYG